jgi:hypothetical protein
MFAILLRAVERLPKPFIALLPITFAFLGPGLLLWLLAFHVPVPYPQETMAPYPVESPATMELGRPPHAAHAPVIDRVAAMPRDTSGSAALTRPFDQAHDDLLQETLALAERAGTQLYLDSRHLNTSDPLERCLIDARLHLAYSRIDRTTLADEQSALRDLRCWVRSDLQAALAQAPKPVRSRLQPLDQELQVLLDSLATGTGAPSKADRLRYELANADLQALARGL